jgi:hypothetical protein
VVAASTTVAGATAGVALLGATGEGVKKIANAVIDYASDVVKGGTGENVEAPKVVPTLVDLAIAGAASAAGAAWGGSIVSEVGGVTAGAAAEGEGELLIRGRENKREAEPHKERNEVPKKPAKPDTDF